MQPLLGNVVIFVDEKRGTECFRGMTRNGIHNYLWEHNNAGTLVVDWTDEGKILGVVTYDIEEYIPLKIRISEALCLEKGSLARCLREIASRMPKSFRCIAQRGRKIVEYKNPRRIIELLTPKK